MLGFNKKAQVGETTTWIVVTVIIVILLLIFVYVSSTIAKAKSIERFAESIDFSGQEINANWIKDKSEFAFDINSDNKKIIEEWINEEKS